MSPDGRSFVQPFDGDGDSSDSVVEYFVLMCAVVPMPTVAGASKALARTTLLPQHR